MKKTGLLGIFIILAGLLPLHAQEKGDTMIQHYTNPLDVKVADPHIIRHDGLFYLYGTGSDPNRVTEGFPVWTSPDLVNWQERGLALQKQPGMWGEFWFWGPEMVKRPDGFYLFYGAFKNIDGHPTGRICVARSDNPLGPFKDVAAPLFEWEEGDAIDASVFEDDDGRCYLFFTGVYRGNVIYAVPLAEDLLSLDGEPVLVSFTSQAWEEDHVNEGAYVYKHEGRYFMLFAGNDFRNTAYAVGLATANHPMGPWTKIPHNPLVSQTPYIKGCGCACLIPSADEKELFIYYHVHLSPDGYMRQLALDRAWFDQGADGNWMLRTDGPNHLPQPWPSGSPYWKPGESDDFSGPELDRSRWIVLDESPDHWKILPDGGLEMTLLDGDMWGGRADYRNIFLQYAPEGDFSIETRVHIQPKARHEQAFLCLWQNADNYLRLSSIFNGKAMVELVTEMDGQPAAHGIENTLGKTLYLRIKKKGILYEGFVSKDGQSWEKVGETSVRLKDLKMGFGALGAGSKRGIPVRFDYFRLHPGP